jgi:hypothetical protein
MTPINPQLHPGAILVIFAEDQQEEFTPLPASVGRDGSVMTEWVLSPEERQMLLSGGRVRLWLMNTGVQFGKPLTPMMVEIVAGESGKIH